MVKCLKCVCVCVCLAAGELSTRRISLTHLGSQMAGLRSNSSRIFISRNALQSTRGSRVGISLEKHVFSFVASVSPRKVLRESPPRQHQNKAFVNNKRKGE